MFSKRVSLFLVIALCALSLPSFSAVGGGYSACGLSGSYFSNPTFSGTAVFTRQDNRLNFDWGLSVPIGGSNTPSYRNFPNQNFSIRWSGTLVPRFSEPYTLTITAEGNVQVTVSGALVINQQLNDAASSSAPLSFTAGSSYPITVAYAQTTNPAKIILRWSSPSTPQEVIDPISVRGFNLTNCNDELFADDVKYSDSDDNNASPFFWYAPNGGSNAAGIPLTNLDSSLWPTQDAVIRIDPYFPNATYLMQFTGRADVSTSLRWFGGKGTLTVNGVPYTTLPSGVGYDAVSNTTTALLTPPHYSGGLATYSVQFSNSQRTATSALNTGITGLHIMRPQSKTPGSPNCPLGTVVYPSAKTTLQHYTVYRYFSGAFADEETWAERTLPGMPNFQASPPDLHGTYTNKPCWEYLIMLANEMGKDLYLSISSRADAQYVTNLAYLVKYGSDGVNPYTSESQWPGTGPVYPPLNPNLRFYIEYSNEVWNWGFAQNGWIYQDSKDAVTLSTAGTLTDTPPGYVTAAEGALINYDGNGFGNWQRWQALQTVQISNTFRQIFGDAAMGERIRILLFDQYGNYGNTLGQFIDNYFNKTDPKSTFAGPAHPVSYYVWGGGGAIYYGSTHPTGVDPDVSIANGSFETPALAVGAVQVNPVGSSWTFTGNAGILHNSSRTSAIAAQTPGTVTTPATAGWVGFKFTVGATPIYVYDLARMMLTGNSGSPTVCLFDSAGNTLASVTPTLTGSTAGQYVWTRIIEPGYLINPEKPLLLAANTTYYLMSNESSNQYYGSSAVTPAPGITINCAATAPGNIYTTPVFVDGGTANTAMGLVNFDFASVPQGALGFTCDAPDGVQDAFIGDTGAMSQMVNFSKTGTFALGFFAGGETNAGNPVDIYVDGVKYTPQGGDNPVWTVSTSPWTPGGWDRQGDDLSIWWGSATFPITTTGNHLITIQGTGAVGQYTFFDNITMLSEDGIYGTNCSYFPAMGQANGQAPAAYNAGLTDYISTLHGENNWATSWGIKTMAYEGGWSVGGDFDQKPIHSYCKYKSPQTIVADGKAIDVYTTGGGSMFCYYYSQWPDGDVDNGTQYSLVQASMQSNNKLPAEASNGTLVPATLTGAAKTLLAPAGADAAGNLTANGAWISWNIIAPATQTYSITSAVSGTGGSYVLLVDDATTVASGNSGATALSGSVLLTKGEHAVKVRSTSATAIDVSNVLVAMVGNPATPSLLNAHFANGNCTLTWSASPTAVSYIIYYGITTDNYSNSITVGNVTSYTLTGLDNAGVYYCVVQAVDANYLLSLCSNELRVAQRSTYPQALIDFEDQPVDGTTFKSLTEQNYQFSAVGNLGTLEIQGTGGGGTLGLWPNGWSSKVLWGCSWGESNVIQRADGMPFDLYSLNLDSIYGNYSAVITGYDPAGSTFSTIINFPNQAQFVVPVTLDWVRVAKVQIRWCHALNGGGSQDVCGAIDNLLMNNAAMTAATPTFTPDAGSYFGAQTVSINCATLGATVMYTLDGSTPSSLHGTPYTALVPVNISSTLQAIAYEGDLADSAVKSAAYTIKAPTVTLTAPTNGQVYLSAPAVINLAAIVADSSGTISRVSFYNGSILLGTSTNSPYTFSWTNVASGNYALTASATDSNNAVTTSGVVNVQVNGPLTVSLTAPTPGKVYLTNPASITLSATAADTTGTITQVAFYTGSTLLGVDTSAPYNYTWQNVAPGSYNLTAVVTNNFAATTTSGVVNVRVDAPPTVSLTSPANNTLYSPAPIAALTLSASAADSDGTVSQVAFYNGATLLGGATSSPYSYNWTSVPAGSYTLTAVATDNDGATTTSSVVNVVVHAPPTVSFANPTNGKVYSAAPATIVLTPTVSAQGGVITSVTYYNGAVLLGMATASPFTFTWGNVPVGSYTLTAVVSDSDNALTTSSPITIKVSTPPTISPLVNQSTGVNVATSAQIFNVSDTQTPDAALLVTASSSNTTLIPVANVAITAPTAAGACSVIVTPAAGQTGVATITLTVTNGDTLTAFASFIVSVAGYPTISIIANKSVNIGVTATSALGFTIGDSMAPVASLLVSAISSNGALVSSANITLGGTGSARTVKLTLTPGISGVTTITLSVKDGFGQTASSIFTLTVYGRPTITGVANQSLLAGAATAALAFTVGDSVTAHAALLVTCASSLTTLVPTANIALTGPDTAGLCSLVVTPVAGKSGVATITLTVKNGGAVAASTSFSVSVFGQPTITTIPNKLVSMGFTATSALGFTVGDATTPVSALQVSATSSNSTLVPQANIVLAGTGAARSVQLKLPSNVSGVTTITITVSNGYPIANAMSFTLTVNARPTITAIAGQSVLANIATATRNFTVGDDLTPASALTVTGASSNQLLVPVANIVLGGTGAARTVKLTPAAGMVGVTTITLTVKDGGGLGAVTSFPVFVYAAPTISSIGNKAIRMGTTATSALGFSVGDSVTATTALLVTATSSNVALVPLANVALGGSGASRTVQLTPLPGVSGVTTITLTVKNGYPLTTSMSFTLTVNARPTISVIANQTIAVNSATPALAFTVGDDMTPVGALVVTGASNNSTLVPPANIVIGGAGAARTVTVTPAPGKTGTATITLTVMDGGGLAGVCSFVVTVH